MIKPKTRSVEQGSTNPLQIALGIDSKNFQNY